MNENESVKSSVVLDKSMSAYTDENDVYAMSEMFEKDARRYNRAFLEEQEVAVR